MANSKCRWEAPSRWNEWSEWLAAGLHARHRWRLAVLLLGILFARGRRTVTTWLRAAGVSDDFQDYYYFLAAVGRKSKSISMQSPAAHRLGDASWGGRRLCSIRRAGCSTRSLPDRPALRLTPHPRRHPTPLSGVRRVSEMQGGQARSGTTRL